MVVCRAPVEPAIASTAWGPRRPARHRLRMASPFARLTGQPGMNDGIIKRGRGTPPLYVQMAEEILGRIRRGDLRPGDRVASEPELMRSHEVSRATAVRALEYLER